jgi:hypothetical protein
VTVLAAAEQGGGSGSLLTGAVILLALYLAACWIWPYVDCGKCKGAGRSRSPSGKGYRRCSRCKGSPERVRWGAKLIGARKGK